MDISKSLSSKEMPPYDARAKRCDFLNRLLSFLLVCRSITDYRGSDGIIDQISISK
jgi:hypothetical protein